MWQKIRSLFLEEVKSPDQVKQLIKGLVLFLLVYELVAVPALGFLGLIILSLLGASSELQLIIDQSLAEYTSSVGVMALMLYLALVYFIARYQSRVSAILVLVFCLVGFFSYQLKTMDSFLLGMIFGAVIDIVIIIRLIYLTIKFHQLPRLIEDDVVLPIQETQFKLTHFIKKLLLVAVYGFISLMVITSVVVYNIGSEAAHEASIILRISAVWQFAITVICFGVFLEKLPFSKNKPLFITPKEQQT